MKVHILLSSTRDHLTEGGKLVFNTLRVGFPSYDIKFYLNDLKRLAKNEAIDLIKKVNGSYTEVITETEHHKWIDWLLSKEIEPFYLCDPDVIFWKSFEPFAFSKSHLAGRLIPDWKDDYTNCITRSRLHTSLLYIDPLSVLQAIKNYHNTFNQTKYTPSIDLIAPIVIPNSIVPYFYDTLSLLYHAVGGNAFDTEHLECYDHMNFGTCEDIVIPCLPYGDKIRAERDYLYKNPNLIKEAWKIQDNYYAQRAV